MLRYACNKSNTSNTTVRSTHDGLQGFLLARDKEPIFYFKTVKFMNYICLQVSN